ncbi:hypothetical protein Herbaro_21355 [Herbaspirillum sp. WKF16]|uniref:hypothetical protein n=1 Tax=Herbaspirillum sp. WKF16 TaxID=3028312 RepID=UPI0023A9E427|nr:hypothetical protein [Herbaspirillum sp. WKF16]WDZ95993.1 hypothetical protein Herbaro_21355 [Herbaspirillum sp. WKF16]
MNAMFLRRMSLGVVVAAALLAGPAHAQSTPSNASTISVVTSVVLPAMFISEAGTYVVKGVQASGQGTLYVLEKASDGVRGSLTIAGNISGAVSVGVGESVRFVATSSGMLLVSAGKVLAIIPNELGRALMKSDKLS